MRLSGSASCATPWAVIWTNASRASAIRTVGSFSRPMLHPRMGCDAIRVALADVRVGRSGEPSRPWAEALKHAGVCAMGSCRRNGPDAAHGLRGRLAQLRDYVISEEGTACAVKPNAGLPQSRASAWVTDPWSRRQCGNAGIHAAQEFYIALRVMASESGRCDLDASS